MTIAWDKVLPVLVSIGIIITVALLREKSSAFSAVAATMPINIPLGMWIVYSAAEQKTSTMQTFTTSVAFNMIPTMIFAVVVMLAARQSWGLVPSILVGYVGWGISFVLIALLRQTLGI